MRMDTGDPYRFPIPQYSPLCKFPPGPPWNIAYFTDAMYECRRGSREVIIPPGESDTPGTLNHGTERKSFPDTVIPIEIGPLFTLTPLSTIKKTLDPRPTIQKAGRTKFTRRNWADLVHGIVTVH